MGELKISVKRPCPTSTPDYRELWVNGYVLGRYHGGKDKFYLNPEKWAEKKIKERNESLDRNIKRLDKEMTELLIEKMAINGGECGELNKALEGIEDLFETFNKHTNATPLNSAPTSPFTHHHCNGNCKCRTKISE